MVEKSVWKQLHGSIELVLDSIYIWSQITRYCNVRSHRVGCYTEVTPVSFLPWTRLSRAGFGIPCAHRLGQNFAYSRWALSGWCVFDVGRNEWKCASGKRLDLRTFTVKSWRVFVSTLHDQKINSWIVFLHTNDNATSKWTNRSDEVSKNAG